MAKKSRNQARLHRAKRVRKKIFGTPERPRMNVFRSINEIYVQLIDDHSGTTLASASSVDAGLRAAMEGKNKIDQARLVGEEIAKRALDKGIKKVVMDRAGYYYTGRIKSMAEGARKGGLEF
ncbi:MAG TPA: 50S ribosomal protein L18 [Anaerolineaceae bacterium]|jgi:large subunit ribosomal protein L18|nr:50S ribosomal protein L18 [Chloroflexota bacterium]HPL82507.1 50S ribosomal protein L18 [Anaerolineaceae bacterium]